MIEVFSRLVGTFSAYFRIGPIATYLRLKNTSGNLDLRNTADSAYIGVTSLWSRSIHVQKYVTTETITIPADYQAIFSAEVSGTATWTITGQLAVV